ncbi:hypothetical protein IE81DRAFT_124446 [Ceraceosorus guamensis]|uniref:BTB domain-containing protein n=1 Tax=Ceraceosorus guamensis TaxID=1522189 RepID=A0A316VYG1_9BASI|nr:hypothetical protein IE81DRAFT_124446 [Ceraceosorus guamensis]PWN42482.1 hypothetical protein IE81DRAFT_124446 [Ceraceosorus guamensis]
MGDQSETSTSGAATKMRKLSLEDQGTGSMSRSQQHEGRQHLNTLSQLFEADQNDHRGRMLKKLHDLGFPPALIHLVPRYWSRGHSERYNDVKEKRSSVAVHVAVAQENEWFRTMLASGLSEAQALQEGKPVYVELDTNFLILEAFAKYLYVGNVRTVVEPARTLVGGLAGLFGLARQVCGALETAALPRVRRAHAITGLVYHHVKVLDTNLAQAALDAYAEHIDRKPMLSQLADPLVVQHRELAFVALRAAFMVSNSWGPASSLADGLPCATGSPFQNVVRRPSRASSQCQKHGWTCCKVRNLEACRRLFGDCVVCHR